MEISVGVCIAVRCYRPETLLKQTLQMRRRPSLTLPHPSKVPTGVPKKALILTGLEQLAGEVLLTFLLQFEPRRE